MNEVNEVIKTVMKDHNISQAKLGRILDRSPQSVYNKFQRGTWDVSEVVQFLDAIDCRLVIESGSIRKYVF